MIAEINRKNARIWSMLGMRRVIGAYINNLAENNDKFVFVTADVGRYYGVQDFVRNYPQRYIDVGIAEQNLVVVAAGLQKEGCNVFAATYSTFITARALDQVRVNLGYMRLGVTLIGVGGGFAEGDLSPTHMGLEDMADMLAIPGITVVCPGDVAEVIKAMDALSQSNIPAYLRLTGKTSLPILHTEDFEFQIGKSICLREGNDLVMIGTGCILGSILNVAKRLEKEEGISCRVVNMHTVRPIDEQELDKDIDYHLMVTIEEHMVTCGLGSTICNYYGDKAKHPIIYKIGVNDKYPLASEYDNILKNIEMDENNLYKRIKEKYLSLQ